MLASGTTPMLSARVARGGYDRSSSLESSRVQVNDPILWYLSLIEVAFFAEIMTNAARRQYLGRDEKLARGWLPPHAPHLPHRHDEHVGLNDRVRLQLDVER